MERTWISAHRSSESYKNGVEEFLQFASQNPLEDGKMACPCNRCGNLANLKKRAVRKHLLKHGFDRDYTRWVCHGEIDLTACSAVESTESTEKNDGDVDQGNEPKSSEEPGESADLPKHAKKEGKDKGVVLDEGSDDPNQSISEEVQNLGSDGLRIMIASEVLRQGPEDQNVFMFAFCLYKMRKEFGWSRESFDHLIYYLRNVFPGFERLPKYINAVWNIFNVQDSNLTNSYGGGCPSSWESISEQLDKRRKICYACGQEMKSSDASTSVSSKGKRRNKRQPPPKN